MSDQLKHISSSANLDPDVINEARTEFVRLVSGEVADFEDSDDKSGKACARKNLDSKLANTQDRPAWIIVGLFIGYAYYNTLRGAFPIQMRRIAEDLKIHVSQIGLPNSVFSAFYGLGKFFGSIATDYLPCAEFHTLGILLCGLDVAAVGLCRGIGSIAAVWSLQGVLQAFGWPFLSRVLIDKLSKEQCAKYWGVLSMAGNIGSMAVPYGTVFASKMGMSWRATLRAFGTSSVAVTLLVHAMLRRGGARGITRKADAAPVSDAKGEEVKDNTGASKASFRAAMLSILRDPALLAIFLCNSLSFGASKCTKEWGAMWLRGTSLAASEMQSATLLFWAEVGGSLGAALSGFVSNSLGGRHALTCLMSAILGLASTAMLALRSFAWRGQGSGPLEFRVACFLQACSLAGINGVRTLAGLHLAEVAKHRGKQLGLSNGFAELVGQVGSVLSGMPVGAAVARSTSAATVAGFDSDRASRAGWAAVPAILTMACGGMSLLNLALLPQENRRMKAGRSEPSKKQVAAVEDGEAEDKLKGA